MFQKNKRKTNIILRSNRITHLSNQTKRDSPKSLETSIPNPNNLIHTNPILTIQISTTRAMTTVWNTDMNMALNMVRSIIRIKAMDRSNTMIIMIMDLKLIRITISSPKKNHITNRSKPNMRSRCIKSGLKQVRSKNIKSKDLQEVIKQLGLKGKEATEGVHNIKKKEEMDEVVIVEIMQIAVAILIGQFTKIVKLEEVIIEVVEMIVEEKSTEEEEEGTEEDEETVEVMQNVAAEAIEEIVEVVVIGVNEVEEVEAMKEMNNATNVWITHMFKTAKFKNSL